MDNKDAIKQAQSTLNELLRYSFSQIFDIAPAEKKLNDLLQDNPNTIEILISLVFCSIMLGKRNEAKEFSDKTWSIGGDLSPFFELVYTDCLLNIGEVEKAGILLQSRLENIGDNLQHFYMVMVKYALLSGNLVLLKQIGEYPGMYDREPALFDFANAHALNSSVKDYRAVIQTILDNTKDTLCAFEYGMYPGEGLELVLYTNEDAEQNTKREEQLFDKIDGYFLSMESSPFEDLFIEFENIKLHPSWLNVD